MEATKSKSKFHLLEEEYEALIEWHRAKRTEVIEEKSEVIKELNLANAKINRLEPKEDG